jgi:hypothetical protein
MAEVDDDFLDGCELDFDDPEMNCPDKDIDALVLFADVDFLNDEVVAARKAEYAALAEAGVI